MTKIRDDTRELRLSEDTVGGGYFRHAVYNHWDPYEDVEAELVETDRRRSAAADTTEQEFLETMQYVALFGAGEEAVTEDLAPLLVALDDINDQMFLASQVYEEAKHAQFFDRYWREVIYPTADAHGFERVPPTDQRFFPEGYVELFERTASAMERLLTDDTPENRVRAYAHYHLVVESVLAQTGYYGISNVVGPDEDDPISLPGTDAPHLPGLVKGVNYIRADEGRHVGFGMQKVQQHLAEDGVDESVVRETLVELMPLVAETVSVGTNIIDPAPLVRYAREKLTRRIEIITNADAEIPPVEELVALDDASAAD